MLEPSRSALLIEEFANTVNLEYGTDAIDTPDRLALWLVEHTLLDASGPSGPAAVDGESHQRGLRLRAGIRDELGVHVGVDPRPGLRQAAGGVLGELPVLIGLHGEPLRPAPGLSAADTALARLAIAWTGLRLTGEAGRLKRCAEHSCELVFWDASKNRSRRWCSMRVCGNRVKARRYAARSN
ncbi:CGNR zinc finger domain-containing protein [Kitasatospora sp. NPDC002543]